MSHNNTNLQFQHAVKLSLIFLWLTALMIFQMGMIQSSRAAVTNAAISYKTLADMFQPIAEADQTKLEIQMFFSSTNKAVHPSDISLTIHSAKGMIPVQLNTNGQLIKFPLEKDLRRENPPIVVNQPAGTMRFQVAIQLPPLDALTFHYKRLGDGVAEINKLIKVQAGMLMSLLAPKVRGVIFLFPKTSAGKAKVEIASVAGKKEYTADKNGRIKLKLEKALLSENPKVKVSEKPQHIVPDMEDMK
ncbi:MAG: DUF2987 domain-containing protein [Limisphaerales bacterium]